MAGNQRHGDQRAIGLIVSALRVGSAAAAISDFDRDRRYRISFDRRARHLGIKQVRTPFRSPRANAIADSWVKGLSVFVRARIDRLAGARLRFGNLILGLERPAAR